MHVALGDARAVPLTTRQCTRSPARPPRMCTLRGHALRNDSQQKSETPELPGVSLLVFLCVRGAARVH